MIIRVTMFSLLLVILSHRVADGETDLSAEQNYDKNKEAVVQIYVKGIDAKTLQGKEKWGTGFFIHKDGYLLTAAHVLGLPSEWQSNPNNTNSPTRKITIRRLKANDQAEEMQGVVVIVSDEALDLALIRVICTDCKPVKFGDSVEAKEGMAVNSIVWGGTARSRALGGTASPYDSDNGGLFRLDMSLKEGDSGAPVFDKVGRVVAIVNEGRRKKGEVYGLPINLTANVINMTRRYSEIQEALELLTRINTDPELPVFPNVQEKFKTVESSLKTLSDLAEQLKQSARLTPVLSRQKNPGDGTDQTVLSLRLEKDFDGQYTPTKIDVRVYPSWQIALSDDDKRKTDVPTKMTGTESRSKEVFYRGDQNSDQIQQAIKETSPINFVVDADIKHILKQRYELNDATMRTFTIMSVDVEMEWRVPNLKDPKRNKLTVSVMPQ